MSGSSSSSNANAANSKLRRGTFKSASKIEGALAAVIDILYHTRGFYAVLKAAEPLDMIGTEDERLIFLELKKVLQTIDDGASDDSVDLSDLVKRLSRYSAVTFKPDVVDITGVWDSIVRLIMVVIPPLREIFLGHITNSRERMESPGWLNIMSRSFRARFTNSCTTLEEICQDCYTSVSEKNMHGADSALKSTQTANAMILRRAPEFFVASVESSYLDPLLEQINRARNQTAAATASASSAGGDDDDVSNDRGGNGGDAVNSLSVSIAAVSIGDDSPKEIKLSATLDLNAYAGTPPGTNEDDANCRLYDLSAIVSLQGPNLEDLVIYMLSGRPDGGSNSRWLKVQVKDGSISSVEESSEAEVVNVNLYQDKGAQKVHPRMVMYTRKDIYKDFETIHSLVTKAGQMRQLGDVAFALTQSMENYEEARQYYEEAIRLDESYRESLQENLVVLETFDRTQKARKLEEQADLALANKHFKEAADHYRNSMKSALDNSRIYLRVKEKHDSVNVVLGLETSTQLIEKGESALKNSQFGRAKELYSQALSLNPDLIHLQCILSGIEKTIQMRASALKISDAHTVMKAQRYREANALYREAISLDPSIEESLRETLQSLGPLMQGEDAMNRKRQGLQCIEDKQYQGAIQSFTDGISLLPPNSESEHASLLADRAQVHLLLHDYPATIDDCKGSLVLKSDLALAHLRLGAAYFGLDDFEAATSSYERALKHDSTLSDQVKAKLRQVNSAREVQQRKLREEEREREKVAQEAMLKEKREKEEQTRREKAEKAAKEKAERLRLKEVEKQDKLSKDKEAAVLKASQKEADAERKKREKVEAKENKAKERELAKAEKERKRDEERKEKERIAAEAQATKESELKRRRDMQEEQERAQAKKLQMEMEQEAAKERARLETERLIEERTKAREQKEREKEKDDSKKEKKGKQPQQQSQQSNDSIVSGVGTKKRSPKLDPSGLSGFGQKLSQSTNGAAASSVAPEFNSWGNGTPDFNATPVISTSDFPALGQDGPSEDHRLRHNQQQQHPDILSPVGGGPRGLAGLSNDGGYSELSANTPSFVYNPPPGPPMQQQQPPVAPIHDHDLRNLSTLPSLGSDEGRNVFSTDFGPGLFGSSGSLTSEHWGDRSGSDPSNGLGLGSSGLGGGEDPLLRAIGGLTSSIGNSLLSGIGDDDPLDSLTSNGVSDHRNSPPLSNQMTAGVFGDLGSGSDNSTFGNTQSHGGGAPISSLSMMMTANSTDHSSLNIYNDVNLGDNLGGGFSSGLGGGLGSGLGSLGELGSLSSLAHGVDDGLHESSGLGAAPREEPFARQASMNQPNPNVGGGGGGHVSSATGAGGGGEGIDKDILRADMCRSMFPSVAWLSDYGISMYHWSGDRSEWTEYALYIPTDYASFIAGPAGKRIEELKQRSGCRMWMDREKLRGRDENFLVFHRGSSGQPSNMSMNIALDLVSAVMRQVLVGGQQQQHQQQMRF
jgi:hypothetical protein